MILKGKARALLTDHTGINIQLEGTNKWIKYPWEHISTLRMAEAGFVISLKLKKMVVVAYRCQPADLPLLQLFAQKKGLIPKNQFDTIKLSEKWFSGIFADITQLVECQISNLNVASSSLAIRYEPCGFPHGFFIWQNMAQKIPQDESSGFR